MVQLISGVHQIVLVHLHNFICSCKDEFFFVLHNVSDNCGLEKVTSLEIFHHFPVHWPTSIKLRLYYEFHVYVSFSDLI